MTLMLSSAVVFAVLLWAANWVLCWWERRHHKRLSDDYRQRMRDRSWQVVRRKALYRAGHRCEHVGVLGRCGEHRSLECHHKWYGKSFWHEWDCADADCDGRCGLSHGESLQILCEAHHRREHRRKRLRRRPSYVR